jgi:RNA polymerase sigma factor (TIGR02999 family)
MVWLRAMSVSSVTQILNAAVGGDASASEKLLPLVYNELRRLAARRVADETPGQTLQATALVHEAYLRLVDVDVPQRWDGRGHFFAAAAEAMRRILIERARRKATIKHGGAHERVGLHQLEAACARGQVEELLAIDDAIGELERHDAQSAQLVKMRFFAGLSHQEAAEAMGITRRVADRIWGVAKAWLYQRLNPS